MNSVSLWIKRNYNKYLFKKKWRKLNPHNETIAVNIFNSDIVKVGKMSYGPIEVHEWKAKNEKLCIGNYVSIASGVKFILGGNHYYNTFSTYPFKVKLALQEEEAYSNGPIIVDDDVWIGMDTIIMSGVTIGKGAVIAAGSIVTKNILPYCVVGGNPAKLIKLRFNETIINKLRKIDFSEINPDIVRDNINLFYLKLDEDILTKIIENLSSDGEVIK